jgi:hypothetical protein
MSDVSKRRNGIYTCLDCLKSKSQECGGCVSRNWELFELDEHISKLSYDEKTAEYEKRHELCQIP